MSCSMCSVCSEYYCYREKNIRHVQIISITKYKNQHCTICLIELCIIHAVEFGKKKTEKPFSCKDITSVINTSSYFLTMQYSDLPLPLGSIYVTRIIFVTCIINDI